MNLVGVGGVVGIVGKGGLRERNTVDLITSPADAATSGRIGREQEHVMQGERPEQCFALGRNVAA